MRQFWLFTLAVILFFSCKKQPADIIDTEFGDEIPVTILGYDGDAMEPFITKDDKYLLFNSNSDDNGKDLYYARKINDSTFQFLGKIYGTNTAYVDANPSMTRDSVLFFITTRALDSSNVTVYYGQFANGTVNQVFPIQGTVTPGEAYWFNMGVEVTAGGETLFVSTAKFRPGENFPYLGDIHYAVKQGDQYNIPDNEPEILQNINTDEAIEYAGELSADGKELFYSQLTLSNPPKFKLYHAKRTSTDEPFGKPALIPAPFAGDEYAFVEAPTLSADGKRLYYHKLSDGKFRIFMVKRKN